MENLLSLAEIYQQYELANSQFGDKQLLWGLLSILAGLAFIACAIFSAAFFIALIFKLFGVKALKDDSFKELFMVFSITGLIALFSLFVFFFSDDKEDEAFKKKYDAFFHALTIEQKQLLNKEIYIFLSVQKEADPKGFKVVNSFNKDFLENKIKNNSSDQLFDGEAFYYFLGSEIMSKAKEHKDILAKEKEAKIRERLERTRKGENDLEKSDNQSKDCVMFCPR